MTGPEAVRDRVTAAAVDLLDRAARPIGFAASVADAHYDAVWTRDAAITCLAAQWWEPGRWDEAVLATLRTVAERAAPHGQLPNTVWSDGWWDFGEHAAVDPTLWWALAVGSAMETEVDGIEELLPAWRAAIRWLRGLSLDGSGLVFQPVAADWMDSSVQRHGIVLHTNALWVWVLRRASELDLDRGPDWPSGPGWTEVAANLDRVLWPRPDEGPSAALGFLPEDVRRRPFPHPATAAAHRGAARPDRAHWASHRRWGHLVDEVDVLGNALAVLAGVGEDYQHAAVLGHLDDLGVADPHPSRTLGRPVEPGGPDGMLDPEADRNQDPRWRNPPWEYHNAASWPMVGGFHAMAARHAGRVELAERLSLGVARACLEDPNDPDGALSLPEWRHGQTGAPGGARQQVWSAAAVLLSQQPDMLG